MYTGFGVSVLGIVAYRGPYFFFFDKMKIANPWKADRGYKGFWSKFAVAQVVAIWAGLGLSF